MDELVARKQEHDRIFVRRVIAVLQSPYALTEYSERIRKSYPHLNDLAEECRQRAKQAAPVTKVKRKSG